MRKREGYNELLQECSKTAKVAILITVEVRVWGVISLKSFQNLYKALKAPTAKDCCKVKAELVKTTLSFGVEKLEGVVLGL